jgi:hypothetical protein
MMANALMKCIILMLMLFGLLGSFFLKKYMVQTYLKTFMQEIKRHKKSPDLHRDFLLNFILKY